MSKTTFVCISDTHHTQKLMQHEIPDGDFLLFSGDIMTCGYQPHQIEEFLHWFACQPHQYKVWIAGNHDREFERKPDETKQLLKETLSTYGDETYYGFPIYLEDRAVELDGWKIYGSPWQPAFCNWAFNLPRNGKELEEKWAAIPEDTDILLTHGPAFGNLDSSRGVCPPVGCELLAERLKVVKPKIHVFGHIHGGYGVKFDQETNTYYVNASIVNERYVPVNKPIVIELYK